MNSLDRSPFFAHQVAASFLNKLPKSRMLYDPEEKKKKEKYSFKTKNLHFRGQ
jgi:hypothetical protein